MTNLFRNPDALVDAVRAIMIGETNKNDKSDDGEGLDAVQPKAVKKKFADRKDKDIDNDGDTDSSDEYLHKRRKAISKAMKEESDVDEGFINLGGAKVKDDEKSILQHIKKTFPNVKKVKKDSQHGWIPVFEAKMPNGMLTQLKKAYEPMRDKKISMDNAKKLTAIMNKFGDDKDILIQLMKADIPFVSQGAVTRLISKHSMKGAELNKMMKEDVDLEEKTKWKMGDGRPRGGAYIENERFWNLDIDALKYIMKDADAAMKANPTGRKAGKYADEVNDAITVIAWRKKNGIKEEVDLDEAKVKEYKGIAYFENRKDAESHMKKFAPKGRIVEYERGYAIQVRTSGPYLNKSGKINEEVDENDEPCAECGKIHENGCAPEDMKEAKTVKEDDDEDGNEKTDAQKYDMDGDGEKDSKKKKKKKGDDEEDTGEPNKIDTKPEIKTAVSEVYEKKDSDGGDENLMMALRKAVSLRGQYNVAFKDGKKVKISQKDAQNLLNRLQKEKPADREALMKSAYKSEKHFKMALKGHIEKKKNPLDLD